MRLKRKRRERENRVQLPTQTMTILQVNQSINLSIHILRWGFVWVMGVVKWSEVSQPNPVCMSSSHRRSIASLHPRHVTPRRWDYGLCCPKFLHGPGAFGCYQKHGKVSTGLVATPNQKLSSPSNVRLTLITRVVLCGAAIDGWDGGILGRVGLGYCRTGEEKRTDRSRPLHYART